MGRYLEVNHNGETTKIVTEEKRIWADLHEMEFKEISETDINFVTSRLHNWISLLLVQKKPMLHKIPQFFLQYYVRSTKHTTIHS